MSAFQFEVKVYVEDTDYGGIVYHANYLKYMERARTEWLNSIGFSLREIQLQNVLIVVREAQLRYHKPALLNDVLLIETDVTLIKHTRLLFHHRVVKKGTPGMIYCTGEVEIVCTNVNKKPVRIPSIIVEHCA